jgi:hypothetical protein
MKLPWPRYPLIYEINARVWVRELSLRHGTRATLSTIPEEEIEAIARLGFDGVWLMGVWMTGSGPITIAREDGALRERYARAWPEWSGSDVVGSPFAVSRYEVSGELGGPAALASLRARLAYRGLRLLLDFVPNHTACDHHLISGRPEAYVHGTEEDLAAEPASHFRTRGGAIVAHGRDPNFPAWTDTAQLNYGQSPAREAMTATLLRIAGRCDGVRCDMAMLLLPDVMERTWGGRLGRDWIRESFWKQAIERTRARESDFLFLAESYWDLEWRLQQEGFDFTYDKVLYDRLRGRDSAGVRAHLRAEESFGDRCARFIENHDEPRAVTLFGEAPARAAAVASFFAPGLRLFHDGQLEGRGVQLPVQLARRPAEPERTTVRAFYEKLLDVLRGSVFREGRCRQLEVRSSGSGDPSTGDLLALHWRPRAAATPSGDCEHLVVVNLGDRRSSGRIPLPPGAVELAGRYSLLDRYDGERYLRGGSELLSPGLFVALEAYGFHLFEKTEVV